MMHPITVGVGYTKRKTVPIAVCNAFLKGVQKCGDVAHRIENLKDLKYFDAISQYGPWNSGGEKLRGDVHKFCELYKVRKICLDIGYIKNFRNDLNNLNAYSTIGYDNFKGLGTYYNEWHTSSRWDSFNIELKPWRTNGEHILIIGQPQGWSTKHLDIQQWYKDIVAEIRKHTGRPIFFRQHPLERTFPKIKDVRFISFVEKDLEQWFNNCWAVVTKTSSAGISALINGIPVICNDSLMPGYNLAEKNIANIENPATPKREQFFYDLAYTQWNISEISGGEPWEHLRWHLNR
jgi:hypothetical protein